MSFDIFNSCIQLSVWYSLHCCTIIIKGTVTKDVWGSFLSAWIPVDYIHRKKDLCRFLNFVVDPSIFGSHFKVWKSFSSHFKVWKRFKEIPGISEIDLQMWAAVIRDFLHFLLREQLVFVKLECKNANKFGIHFQSFHQVSNKEIHSLLFADKSRTKHKHQKCVNPSGRLQNLR